MEESSLIKKILDITNTIDYSIKSPDMFNSFLNLLLEETDSEYGFIGEILIKNENKYLKTHAITDISWNKETKNLYKSKAPNLEFMNLDNLFGYTIKTGEMIVTDSPSTHPHYFGLPQGHPPLNSYLGYPIKLKDNLMGMVGLANSKNKFNKVNFSNIELIVATLANVIKTSNLTNELNVEKNRKKNIIESARLGTWEWNSITGEIVLNDRWANMVGYTLNQLKPISIDTWKKLCHPDDLLESNKKLEEYFKGNTPYYECECRMRHKDGYWIWVKDTGKTITWNDRNEPVLISGTHTDITCDKNKEKELIKNKEAAEESNKSKSLFLATMSHELRTPLNSIIGFSELLVDNINNTLAPTDIEYAQIINESGKQLLSVINDILEISRIETGDDNLKIDEYSINEQIIFCSKILQSKAVEKNITLSSTILPKDNKVLIDKGKFRQVLLNILGNSIKYTNEGGNVSISVQKEEDGIKILISDNGIGMPEDYIKDLFSPFKRAKNAREKFIDGIGIGLSISKKILEKLNFDISVISELNKGTTFCVTIPKNYITYEDQYETSINH